MNERIDPPDRDHRPECEDSDGAECICDELEEVAWERKQAFMVYDTWREWELDQADRYDLIDNEEG